MAMAMRAVARSRVLAGQRRWLQLCADSPPSWSSRLNKIIRESTAGAAKSNAICCRQAQAPRLSENGWRVQHAYTGAFLSNPKTMSFCCLSPDGSQLEDRNAGGMIHMASSMHRCQGMGVGTGMGAFQVLTNRSSKPNKDCLVGSPSIARSSVGLTEMDRNSHIQPLALFVRAFSIFPEKELDDDVSDMQTSVAGHQQSSPGGQQSSLEVPESKPVSAPSWPNPDNAASYVLMSNIYADGDRWDEVKRINEMRLKARAWKKPGKAYIEVKAKVHEFIVGDRTHQDSTNIYEKLRKIKRHMGHIGYVPYVDLVLENRSYHDPYKPR